MADLSRFIGAEPERLCLSERLEVTGQWIALALYSPATLPLKRIQAIGSSVADCIRSLDAAGLDPRQFEYQRLPPPY